MNGETRGDVARDELVRTLVDAVAVLTVRLDKIEEANRNLLRLVHKKEQIEPSGAGRLVPHRGKVS